MFDLGFEAGDELLDAFLARQVGGQGVATAQGSELRCGLLAGLGITGADIDSGAGLDKSLGDHLADAAGHQGGTALQGKVGMHGES